MMKTKVRVLTALAAAALMPAAGNAQTTAAVAPTVAEAQVVTGKMMAASVESKTTAGRPYSAESVSETVQVLGDGNRITNKNVTRVYRDGEGRTRREVLSQSGAPQNISISDPVARASYTLDPDTKTAYSAAGMVMIADGGGRGGAAPAPPGERRRVELVEGTDASGGKTVTAVRSVVPSAAAGGGGGGRGGAVPVGGLARTPAPSNPNVTREDLGQQMIEGVAATGTRTTTVIPAGAIGNAQEIKVVSEQWFSPDLQVLVMTRHSDPRNGETTYKLTNIVRAEPDPGLFVVPADYTNKSRGVRQPQ
jgi:hypothetical protein